MTYLHNLSMKIQIFILKLPYVTSFATYNIYTHVSKSFYWEQALPHTLPPTSSHGLTTAEWKTSTPLRPKKERHVNDVVTTTCKTWPHPSPRKRSGTHPPEHLGTPTPTQTPALTQRGATPGLPPTLRSDDCPKKSRCCCWLGWFGDCWMRTATWRCWCWRCCLRWC